MCIYQIFIVYFVIIIIYYYYYFLYLFSILIAYRFHVFLIILSNCKVHMIMFGMKNALHKFQLLYYNVRSLYTLIVKKTT